MDNSLQLDTLMMNLPLLPQNKISTTIRSTMPFHLWFIKLATYTAFSPFVDVSERFCEDI
jgi:hypothetical protein